MLSVEYGLVNMVALCVHFRRKTPFGEEEELEQQGAEWRRLIIVANWGLMLCLPHGSGIRVANRGGRGKFATRERLG